MSVRQLRLCAAWLTAAFLAQLFFRMGAGKFDPTTFWTGAFRHWGYPAWMRLLIGGCEVLCGPLLVVPWVSSWAAMPLVVVMVGAVGTIIRFHLPLSAFALDTLYLAALLWVAREWWPSRRPRVAWPANNTSIAAF